MTARRRRLLLIALLLAALVAGAAWMARARISLAIAARVAQAHLTTDFAAQLPDGLHVGLCGAGSPFPDDLRLGPCTAVLAGKRLFIFDAGSGSTRNIGKLGFLAGQVEAIFLTHFHSDHIDGLGELLLQRWVQGGHEQPVPVVGPTGVQQVVDGLATVYAMDRGYRVAHHGERVVPAGGFGATARSFDGSAPVVLLKEGELEISAFPVSHDPAHPAVGYRIRYRDRSVVLSGDTRKSDSVLQAARGADLLVHEALSARMVDVLRQAAQAGKRERLVKIFEDIKDYHASPEEAAETARDAGVRYLLLSHIVPTIPPLPGLEDYFLGDAPRLFNGPVKVGRDGDFISLPAGSQEVKASRRF